MDESLPPPPGWPENQRPPVVPPPPPGPPPFVGLPPRPPKPPRRSSGWMVLSIILMVVLALMIFGRIISARLSPRLRQSAQAEQKLEEVVIEHTNGDSKIAVVEINGVIGSGEADNSGMSLAEYVREEFKSAGADEAVKAVILKVDSPGGEVLASDEIYRVIRKFEDSSDKPVVVSMGALAASGGYYVSTPCRWIVANELTLTGSIGVIMHGYNYRGLMDKVGVQPQVFKSGRFKDMLSGEKEPDNGQLTPQEKADLKDEEAMVQSLINETYGKFKEVVQAGRGWAAKKNKTAGKKLVDNWSDYADGRVLSGKQALDYGFVDELGDFETAVKRAQTLTGINAASLVEYRVPFDFASVLSRVLGKTQTPALKVDLGFNLPKLRAGLLFFLDPKYLPR